MNFHNSGIDFWRQNPSKINFKMTSKIAYLNLTHFGLKIKHKIPSRRSQDAHMTPQEDPRRSKTSPRRLQDASKTTPRRLPDASRYSQDALKTALNLPRHPKMLPRRPKTPQDVSKTPPKRLQTSISGDLWSIFGLLLMAFGLIFDNFFIDFFHCISVTLLLNYMRSWRGGGDAALLRVGSAPGPKAPSCVSTFRSSLLSAHFLSTLTLYTLSLSTLTLYTHSLHSLSTFTLYTHSLHSHTLTLCK